ncbi:MAG TPA: transcription termination factor Rho [Acidimicrobiia bacterium]|jgi:transcription termination factor Rho|nr:transcription termination factor Rho [Acidimicrobiia bacterium]
MSETFDRSQLDGKDREQLSEIASALGVKSISRMRKADLVDAIVNATAGSNGGGEDAAPKTKKVRSARASVVEAGDLASLAAEENALASDNGGGTDEMALIRPRRRTAPTNGSDAATDTPTSATSSDADASSSVDSSDDGGTTSAPAEGRDSGGQQQRHQQDQWRGEEDGQGNRRRRRRRGRDRERGPGDGGGGGGSREPRERNEDYTGELIDVEGLLDLRDEGYGFLRTSGYLAGRNDAYVSASQVRRFGLRKGDYVKGATRPPASSEKYPALVRVDLINNMTSDEARGRVRFEDLTPLFPDSKLQLELHDDPAEITGRIIDLISPIGKGQRGMIVSPPKAGKTTIIKQIVYSIERNNPETHVIVLLVDERPEEVTDMRRHVLRAEVVASTFDRPSDEHCHIAELTIERAKRLVEQGTDVVIILDGITRLARAYNLAAPASGRIMSGGIDAGALYPPKKFFGAARNVEEGGSLTILATALVETNSKMDEHIFEEFKGTGNMELRLDRRTADRRIYPAIDVEQSSTRHEELLFDRRDLQQVWKLRRVLNALEGGSGLELLIDKLRSTKTNGEFLNEISKAPVGMGT